MASILRHSSSSMALPLRSSCAAVISISQSTAVRSASGAGLSSARRISENSYTRRPRAIRTPLSTPRCFSTTTSLAEKRYTDAHEWIELNADGTTGTIGISKYAAKALGDVVYVELPTPDLDVNAGDAIGAVESVKSASDIYTPVAGKIVKSNPLLEEKPGTINKGPEGEGWIAEISINEGESDKIFKLMDAEAYTKFTEE